MHELKRLDVISVGKIMGMVYGLLAVLLSPLFLIMMIAGVFSQDKDAAVISGIVGIMLAVAIPFVYGAMAFVVGCIVALIYNFAAGRVGGVRFELQPISIPPVLPLSGSQNG